MQHRIILPGSTTLTRLISEVREKATLRLWNRLAMIPSAVHRSQLETLAMDDALDVLDAMLAISHT